MSALLGPKPQTRGCTIGSFSLVILGYFCFHMSFTFNIHAPPWQPEGTDSAIGVRGVTLQTSSTPAALTKLDGQRPAPDLALPRRTSKPNAHHKKAYLKAVKRATLHGVTWYRGQYLTATQLGVKSLSLPPFQADSPTQPPGLQTVEVRPNRQPPSAFRQGRPTYLSWDIGQLTLIKWDLFRSWLHRQTVDCVLSSGHRMGLHRRVD